MTAHDLAGLLPAVFRAVIEPGSVLTGLLDVMAELRRPAEATLVLLDRHFDPLAAGPPFVALLAHWQGLGPLLPRGAVPGSEASLPTGVGRLRMLVERAAELSQARGTVPGLLDFLETATGLGGFAIEEGVAGAERHPRAFHLRVVAPRAATDYRGFLALIIEREKPAYVTYELVFES